jgi:hypothetical protein
MPSSGVSSVSDPRPLVSPLKQVAIKFSPFDQHHYQRLIRAREEAIRNVKDALLHGVPVVDITKVARAIHQNHDYAHIAGGQRGAYGGEEARRNLDIYGGVPHAFTLLNATHELRADRSIRRVRYRPQIFRVQQWLWRNFVQRTGPLRKRLGMQRSKNKSNHQNRDAL